MLLSTSLVKSGVLYSCFVGILAFTHSVMEELQGRHRKEQKDLQARITQKKKSATKKTRKFVNDECESLQKALSEKQRVELSQFNGETDTSTVDDALEKLTVEDGEQDGEQDARVQEVNDREVTKAFPPTTDGLSAANTTPEIPQSKRGNRQKARLARRAAEREADADKAAEEAANQTDYRADEQKVMNEVLSRLRLREKYIIPDGHCLYSAVAWQLGEVGRGLNPDDLSSESTTSQGDDGYKLVRETTAKYILSHADDFSPFLEEPIQEYAQKIRSTGEWGGQLELQAIARAYNVRINVIQGDGRIEKFQPDGGEAVDESQTKNLWLAYYRHTYSLGEHYNALYKLS